LILLMRDMVQGLLSLLSSQQRLRCRSAHRVLASVHPRRSLSAGPTGGQPVLRLGGAREDVRPRAREGVQMRLEDGDPAYRAPAVRRFVEAVQALSANPQPENVERYLIASRALERPRSRRKPRPSGVA